jgi:hypothetical protein
MGMGCCKNAQSACENQKKQRSCIAHQLINVPHPSLQMTPMIRLASIWVHREHMYRPLPQCWVSACVVGRLSPKGPAAAEGTVTRGEVDGKPVLVWACAYE